MPETSESIPLIGIYLTTVMAITSVSVVMTVIVLNFFYRGPTVTPVPVWAQIYILRKSRATVIRSKYTKESTINSNYLLTSSGKKLKDPSEHEDLNIRHDESAAIIINNEPEEQTFEGSLNFKLNSSKKKNGALPRSPLAFVNSNNEEDRDYIESSSPEKELNRNHLSSESLSNSDLTRRHSSLNSRRSSHKASNNNNNNFLPKPSTTTTGGSTRNSLLIGGPLSQSKDVYKMDKMMDFMSEKQRDDAMIQEILKDWKMPILAFKRKENARERFYSWSFELDLKDLDRYVIANGIEQYHLRSFNMAPFKISIELLRKHKEYFEESFQELTDEVKDVSPDLKRIEELDERVYLEMEQLMKFYAEFDTDGNQDLYSKQLQEIRE
ncbi:unnamed protein product [Lepeophtheirus salmonis]|uniref:(salmon louse) hypothetical protein n=1 Tax=Lepeophtheirus salmonis TaxID=72036 RepID=A0A7R8HDG9_LEPSM|nr:unnamed protein product [Lepeophtheirus salmonis]CAF3008972.1 unnamed protein product [Lepeophtheirus salmonis]